MSYFQMISLEYLFYSFECSFYFLLFGAERDAYISFAFGPEDEARGDEDAGFV